MYGGNGKEGRDSKEHKVLTRTHAPPPSRSFWINFLVPLGCVYTTSFPGCRDYRTFPKKMAYVIHTEYQYRGKSYNLRSNVVRILRFLNSTCHSIQIFIPKSAVKYCSDPGAESHAWSIIFSLSYHRRSSTFKKTSATSSGACVLAHLLKSHSKFYSSPNEGILFSYPQCRPTGLHPDVLILL